MSDPFVRLSRSDLHSIQQAALNLAEAPTRLASELTDVLCGGYWLNEHLVCPQGWEAENDKLKVFLQFRAIEDGPPPTPQFLLDLLDESVGVHNETDQQDWARPAFWSGFWAAASLSTDTPFSVDYKPENPVYWIVLRGGDWDEPSLFESRADLDRFVRQSPEEKRIVQSLIDLTEVFIFCSGAGIKAPQKWLWTRRN